jgi:hypothetical protein
MKYQPVFISYPSWEEPGPVFDLKDEAQKWLDKKIRSGKPNDWGHIIEISA